MRNSYGVMGQGSWGKGRADFDYRPTLRSAKLHSKIEQGDQEDSDGGVLIVRRSRADAGNEAI